MRPRFCSVHVLDLAEAHAAALAYLLEGGGSMAMNLGAGRGYSVREVLDRIEALTGRLLPLKTAPRRRGDPAELVADSSRAMALLGWRTRHSGLDEIIGTAWAWAKRELGRQS